MTAGAPLYLVSACASGEEFVAAFRRYADRNGVLFVPTREPLSSGKKGRFAVTLKDGGVMLEGDAEVVSSSKTPSVLYGRIGMTIKFTGPDELSKVVLGELEKARLSLKPAAPSVPPRPAELPSDKRPTPPAPGGRIDAVNALAECVLIGELPDAVPVTTGGGGSGRTIAPPLLPLGGRAKKLTRPPAPATPDESARTKTASIPPAIPGLPGSAKATSIGMPAIRTPAAPAPTPHTGFPATPPSTVHGVSQTPREPATQLIAPPPPVLETSEPTETTEPPAPPKFDMNETLRGTLPARPAPREVEIGEPTDLSVMPPMLEGAPTEQTDAAPEPRTTAPGVAVPRSPAVEEPTPSGDWTMTPGEHGPTITRIPRPEPKPAKGPPTGDWMIALDPSRPDGWSEPSKVGKPPPGELPPGPPVSTVSSDEPLDSNANVQHQQEVPQDAPSIEIDPTLASASLDVSDEPSQPVAAAPVAPPVAPLPQGPFVAPLLTPTGMPTAQLSPEQHLAMLGLAQAAPLTDAGDPRYPSGAVPASAGNRRRVVIAATAGGALILGLVLVFALGGGDEDDKQVEAAKVVAPEPSPGSNAGSNGAIAPSVAGSNVAIEEPAKPEAHDSAISDEAPPMVATDGACEVKVTSAPAGAEIHLSGEVVGTTPHTLSLPCGVEAKLSLRRARYVTAAVTVTPSAEKPKPVKVALARVTMTVKVSSVPAGATITVGSKAVGVTPTIVKLPAFEASTLKIAKPGYAAETHAVTPKQNNLSVHAVLKKTVTKTGRR